MSLYIDVDHVTEVLLADGWHTVTNDSFDIDSYEYHHDENALLLGGNEPLIPARGFVFEESKDVFTSGPLTSVLAVRH